MRWIFMCAIVAMFASANAWAADASGNNTPASSGQEQSRIKNPFPHYDGPPRTRLEQISRMEKRLEILKSMSDKDWFALNEQQQRDRGQHGYSRSH